MKTLENSAAWLPAQYARFVVGPAPIPNPGVNELVVRNFAVAINPVDWIKQIVGNFVFGWIKYPFILGSDLAGEVVAVGTGVTRFKPGNRVLAHAIGTDAKRNSAAEGAFQRYTVVLENMTSPIPADLSYERATVLPLGLSTAACGLFEKDQLALEYPSAEAKPNGKTLLVWGGSTSVGCNAIQLAVAAGYDVITTASPKNFAYLKQLGASEVFDYNSPTVITDVTAAFRGKRLAGAMAVGATSATACVDIVGACEGNKFVSMATYPLSFQEPAGGLVQLVRTIATIRAFLWFAVTNALKCRLRGVRTKFVFGSSLAFNDVSLAVYERFLPQALADHRFVPAPEPQVVGTGLEAIQSALDMQKRGVSAAKIVVTLLE